jgi:hypothetical protein
MLGFVGNQKPHTQKSPLKAGIAASRLVAKQAVGGCFRNEERPVTANNMASCQMVATHTIRMSDIPGERKAGDFGCRYWNRVENLARGRQHHDQPFLCDLCARFNMSNANSQADHKPAKS